MEIDITNYCNLKCPLCFRSSFEDINTYHMPLSRFKHILSNFPSLQLISFGFLLSEPTLNPEFLDMCRYVKSQGMRISISSNGNVHESKYWTELGAILTETDKIIWPVDGSTQEMYEKYRVGGKLENVLQNQKTCIESNPNINHVTQFIQFQHNLEDDVENIIAATTGSSFEEIACCGDCGLHESDVKPRWDIESYKKIKKMNIPSNNFECETAAEKIIFVAHNGAIGFCPLNLGSYLKNNEEYITADMDLDTINTFIKDSYNNKHKSSICQFNCGVMSKKLQHIRGLDIVTK